MYLRSLYPDPPPTQEVNFHHILFHRPDQKDWADYTLHIDASNGQRRTYREFLSTIQDAATALGGPLSSGCLGLRGEDGEMVGIMSENSMDYIAVINSLLMITVPFAPIANYSTSFELSHALKVSKATRLFVQAKYLPLVLPAAKEVGISVRKIYLLGDRSTSRPSFTQLIEHVRAKYIPRLAVRPASRDTLAFLVFTSGTSGFPKGAMISHGNLQYSFHQARVIAAETLAVYTPPAPPTPGSIPSYLAFLPIHHTYGMQMFCFRIFLQPSTLVILPKWNVELALSAISKYRITHLPLVPSVVHQLINYRNVKKDAFDSVVSIACGAAHLPPEFSEKMSQLAGKEVHIFEGFGMSECTTPSIAQPFPGSLNGKGKIVKGSLGLLAPGMEARILRDDGSDADVNEPGELWVRGDSVAMGYFNNEEATRGTFFEGGWLRTGDKFRVNEEGYFFFADRAKDTLKVSGSQVSPVEIESVLLAQPDRLIVDATVAGVSGGRTSDEKVPRAWVVLSDSGKKLGTIGVIKALQTWHEKNLSKYKWLRGGIEIVDEIPKNPTGKVLRRVLQEKYENKVNGGRSKL